MTRTSLLLTFFTFLISFTQGVAFASKNAIPNIPKKKEERPTYLVTTNQGNFVIELFPDKAPKTVKNFIHYVDTGFYRDTVFHRLIPDFMIQGGGFTEKLEKKKTLKPIPNESTKATRNLKGALAMARLSAPDTATSQFFINLRDNPHLDATDNRKGYTVFGQVTKGMELLDKLSGTPTGTVGVYRDVPERPIVIKDISLLK